MSTGTVIVQGALQRLGVHSAQKPANSTTLENGRITLNSMVAMWQDDDIDTGMVPLEVIGDELSEPLGITNIIMDNLAILLQPDHEGSTISPQLRVNANKGMMFIEQKYQTFDIPAPVARSTMPLGQGNRRSDGNYNDGIFISKGGTIGD